MQNGKQELNRKFVDSVNSLISEGTVKNRAEIVERLEWNKQTMSAVMNGSMNVPEYIYNKFKKVYNIEADASDYKEKYIGILENQCKDKDRIINDQEKLIGQLRAYISSAVDELKRQQSELHQMGTELMIQTKLNRGYGKAILAVLEVVLHNQEPKKSKAKIRSDVDTLLAESMQGAS